MKKVFIKMNNLTDIKNFLAKAMQVEGDVLVKKGQYVVDGKSVRYSKSSGEIIK